MRELYLQLTISESVGIEVMLDLIAVLRVTLDALGALVLPSMIEISDLPLFCAANRHALIRRSCILKIC